MTKSAPQGPRQYDVFISYRHRDPDQTWVRERLVPRFREEGVRVCLDIDCFRLGTPIVLEMGRAVESSNYTLAVVTPAYLLSTFTELENVLAEHLSLEERKRRLLMVMRETARPRLSMRANLSLDMTDEATFEQNIALLCRHVRTEPKW
jgi:hypothetical protein